MLGIEGAIALVIGRLEAEMPAKVVEIAGRYSDQTDVQLRPPAMFSPSLLARVEPSQYPVVEATPNIDDIPEWKEQYQGTETLWVPYRVRIYVTERGVTFPQTAARRTRLSLAVREILFSSPALQDGPPMAFVDNRTIRSAYSPTGKAADGDARSVAASYTDVTVRVEEMTEPASSAPTDQGTADTIFTSVHPALRG